MTKSGTIKVAWLHKMAKGKGLTAKRARLALTLRKLRSHGRKKSKKSKKRSKKRRRA
jgi:hypothetical protein